MKKRRKGRRREEVRKAISKKRLSNWIGLFPNRIRLKSKSLIGGTKFEEGAGVLIKPCVDHRWRANAWAPGEEED